MPPTHWPEVTYAPMAGLSEITIPPMSCCLGLEDSIEAYVGHMILVFRELWRVLRGNGVAWLNLGDSYATGTKAGRPDFSTNGIVGANRPEAQNSVPRIGTPPGLKTKDLIGIPWRIAFALQADGWYLRSDVIWSKKNPMPESVTDRPTKSHEYLFLLAKNERYYYDQDAIKEPIAESSKQRINQPNFDNQTGGPKDYRNGINSNRSARNTLENFKKSVGQRRNKRTVWSIATKPYKAAHFAVMPEALVEPCILAGCPSRVCVECGEPWVRVVEKTSFSNWKERTGTNNGYGRNDTSGPVPSISPPKIKTTGHTPTCQCCPLPTSKEATRPGITLDPFFGAGTVGVVAKKNKRDWLGVEFNSDYAKMAQERLDQTQPALFAR